MSGEGDVQGYRLIPREPACPRGADFAVRLTDGSMGPRLPEGTLVYVSRRALPEPGDVGIFSLEGNMMCRQYVEDSEGNIYLFALDRSRPDWMLTVPARSGKKVECFGKVLLDPPLPLPVL